MAETEASVAVWDLLDLAGPLADRFAPTLADITTADGINLCIWAMGVLIVAAHRNTPWSGCYKVEEAIMELAMAIFRAVDVPAGVPLPAGLCWP